jgi:FkbM family methyltransferase
LSWQYRRAYATPLDAYKGFLLRTALGRHGAKLLPQREVKLNLPGSSDPLWLRRTTSDFQIFMSLFEKGQYDVVTRLSLPPSPIIFDLGANVGLAVRRISMRVPNARFLAVEPDADNRRMLLKNNQSLLAAGRLTLIDGFVAAADGVASIDRSDGCASMYRMREAGPGEKELIPCYSMETLMKKMDAQTIDLLKCDIEGAEQQLFADCAPWIDRVQSILIECDPPYTYDQFFADLNRVGWKHEVVQRNNVMTCVRRL